jgi:hypothetical protein
VVAGTEVRVVPVPAPAVVLVLAAVTVVGTVLGVLVAETGGG